jgi:hypothetical protein
MATQPLPPDDDEREIAPLSHIPADGGAPIEALVSGTVGDRCVNCGAPLSSDQRYCVVCGERRGAPRFSLAATAAATETETTTVSTSPSSRDPRRPRFGSGTTLVAGVATLLLAILVGVLIGHNTANNQKTIAAGPTKIIRVGGGGIAAPASSGSTVASGSASGSSANSSSAGAGAGAKKSKSGSVKSKSKAAKKAPAISKQQAAAQQGAASKVLGGSHNAPPTVTVGQKAAKGTPGVNKKTGKFDGSFFGG